LALPQQRSRRHEVIIIRAFAQGKMRSTDAPLLLGVVVSRIRGTLRIEPEAIESASPDVPRELTPFLQGQIRQGEETLLLLSVDAIASARSLLDR
jgi:chemotaxis signal transduction protein